MKVNEMQVYKEYKHTLKSGKIFIIFKSGDGTLHALTRVGVDGHQKEFRKVVMKNPDGNLNLSEPTKEDYNLFLKSGDGAGRVHKVNKA